MFEHLLKVNEIITDLIIFFAQFYTKSKKFLKRHTILSTTNTSIDWLFICFSGLEIQDKCEGYPQITSNKS